MKKKVIGIMSLVLAGTMMTASLTGCGTEAKATDQEIPMEEETIVVSDSETEQETEVVNDEVEPETETVAEAEPEVVYEEHEYMFVTNKMDMNNTEYFDYEAMKVDSGTYDLHDSINLYSSKGDKAAIVGYTKPNITVEVMRSSKDWYELYFENEDDVNKYRLVRADDFIEAAGIEIKEKISPEDVIIIFNDLYADKVTDEWDASFEGHGYTEFGVSVYKPDDESSIAEVIEASEFSKYDKLYIEYAEELSDKNFHAFRVYYNN